MREEVDEYTTRQVQVVEMSSSQRLNEAVARLQDKYPQPDCQHRIVLGGLLDAVDAEYSDWLGAMIQELGGRLYRDSFCDAGEREILAVLQEAAAKLRNWEWLRLNYQHDGCISRQQDEDINEARSAYDNWVKQKGAAQ